MSGNTPTSTTTPSGGGNQAVASRRAILGAVAVLPLATMPAVAESGDDADLLRLEGAIGAVRKWQEALVDAAEAAGPGQVCEALWKHACALTDQLYDLEDQVIDTPAATEAGRRAKARIVLRRTLLDADGWPLPEDALAWSLARDVLRLAGTDSAS